MPLIASNISTFYVCCLFISYSVINNFLKTKSIYKGNSFVISISETNCSIVCKQRPFSFLWTKDNTGRRCKNVISTKVNISLSKQVLWKKILVCYSKNTDRILLVIRLNLVIHYLFYVLYSISTLFYAWKFATCIFHFFR